MADGKRRSVWTALTVPTFKMRIGQTFVVVLCIVLSLIIVGAVVLLKSASSRGKAEDAARLYQAADILERAASGFEAASSAQSAGETDRAIELSGTAREKLANAGAILSKGSSEAIRKQAGVVAELEAMSVQVPPGMTGSPGAALVDGMREEASDLLAEAVDQGNETVRFGVIAYAIILVMTFILGMLTMTVAYRGLSGVIKNVIAEVKEISSGKGDLTARVNVPTPDVHGELADAINDMVASLRSSTLEIRTIATSLTGSAESLANSIEGMSAAIEEVSAAAEQISTGSEDQARKVEDTSIALGSVSRSLEDIARKARVSSERSTFTADVAGRGEHATEETVTVMREIYESVRNSELLMKGLGERFTQIGIIIDVITDIADQTNLLALNAAIEAARAGEHGKGFSVVAGEVRNLAENSKRSAEQISHLIREIVSETDKVAASMSQGTERVESGRQVAENAGEALEGIMESSAAAARAAQEISSSIQEIAGSTDSVFGAANDIAAIAEETAASTEEVAATLHEQRVSIDDVSQASLELARLASKLHELTEGYRL